MQTLTAQYWVWKELGGLYGTTEKECRRWHHDKADVPAGATLVSVSIKTEKARRVVCLEFREHGHGATFAPVPGGGTFPATLSGYARPETWHPIRSPWDIDSNQIVDDYEGAVVIDWRAIESGSLNFPMASGAVAPGKVDKCPRGTFFEDIGQSGADCVMDLFPCQAAVAVAQGWRGLDFVHPEDLAKLAAAYCCRTGRVKGGEIVWD